MDEPVVVLPYDPAWPGRFEAEAALLREILGPWITGGVHHVGSTSVPGLPAKPIIDIAVGVTDLDSTRPCIELLAEHEYCYAPYLADEMHWFCKPDPSRRTHHLHLMPTESPRFADELVFRDRLRADPTLAREYAELKLRLAEIHRDDRNAYTEAKGEFVARAVGR